MYLRKDNKDKTESKYGVYKDDKLNETHSKTFRDAYHWRMEDKDRKRKTGRINIHLSNCDRLAMTICDRNSDLMRMDGINNLDKDIRYKILGNDKYGKLRIISLRILDYNGSWIKQKHQYIIDEPIATGCRKPTCK